MIQIFFKKILYATRTKRITVSITEVPKLHLITSYEEGELSSMLSYREQSNITHVLGGQVYEINPNTYDG